MDSENHLEKNQTSIPDKNSKQSKNGRELPQPDKEYLWKTCKYNHT